MNELQIVNLENTDITTWDFPMLKAELQRRLDAYSGLVYTDDSIKEAKNDRATLNKVKKAIDEARKAYKAKCLAPYEAMEPQIKELLDLVEGQRTLIDDTVKDYESRQKEAKEVEVRKFYDRKAVLLGDLADVLYPKLFSTKWTNASTGKAKYEEDIQIAINGAANDIASIKALNSPFVDTLIAVFTETLSMDRVNAKQAELEAAAKRASLTTVEQATASIGVQTPAVETKNATVSNAECGTVIKIHATQNQMNQITDFMKAIGVHYELV